MGNMDSSISQSVPAIVPHTNEPEKDLGSNKNLELFATAKEEAPWLETLLICSFNPFVR